jgi:Lon protease-like protein
MGGDDFDPATFSGRVPIFPLPNVVLFPHGLLPLHIFEPRYREMTRAALDGERLIAMALLKPGWEADYQGRPPVYDVVGVGRILQDAKLPDGRYNLLLAGVGRARILEEVQSEPFREARVELLASKPAVGASAERRKRLLLSFYAAKLKEALPPGQEVPAPPDDVPLGDLCDLVLSVLALEVGLRQEFLAELDVDLRAGRLLKLIQGAPGPSEGWPPAPSLN